MTDDLLGRVVLVTGAGRGIGHAAAAFAASLGASVVVNDAGLSSDSRTADPSVAADAAAVIAAEARGRIVASAHDLRERPGGVEAVELALSITGKLDAVIHCAGQGGMDIPAEDNDPTVVADLATGAIAMLFNVVTPSLQAMQRQRFGRIVLISSGTGIFGTANHSAYAAAKMGAIGLTKALVTELDAADGDIGVNAVVPVARTRMADVDGLPGPEAIAPALVALAHPSFEGSGDVYSVAGDRISRVAFALTESEVGVTTVGDALDALNRARIARAVDEPRTMAEAMLLRLGTSELI